MRAAAPIGLLAVGGCASLFAPGLPEVAPPLYDMHEPLELQDEPADEVARLALPAGTFSGVYVASATESLAGLLGEPSGLEVVRIVENSPGEAAGLEVGDLLLEARIGDDAPVALRWVSEWRQLELDAAPQSRLHLVYDRAGVEREAELTLVPRVRAAPRVATERVREEERVGVVLRTATEVEARAAGLGPGGGAVLVGMARSSPWRVAGLRFGDLVAEVEGQPVADPQMLLQAIRSAPADGELALEVVRDGARMQVETAVSERASEVREFSIPLIFSYSKNRDISETSALLWLYQFESTPAAWEMTLLWLITFSGSQADRLEVIE